LHGLLSGISGFNLSKFARSRRRRASYGLSSHPFGITVQGDALAVHRFAKKITGHPKFRKYPLRRISALACYIMFFKPKIHIKVQNFVQNEGFTVSK
jgi:hypothetical protein